MVNKSDITNKVENETPIQRQERIAKFLSELREKNGTPRLNREEQIEIEDRLNTELRNMNRARRIHTKE